MRLDSPKTCLLSNYQGRMQYAPTDNNQNPTTSPVSNNQQLLPFNYLHPTDYSILANTLIQKTITITAAAEQVWRVFTDPVVTRKMGGEYVSTWQVGDPLGWKGEDGIMSTYGIILEIEPNQLLKHSLYDLKTKSRLTSTITYRLEDKGKYTILHADEELAYDMRDDQFEEALEGWDLALESVKEIAENLK